MKFPNPVIPGFNNISLTVMVIAALVCFPVTATSCQQTALTPPPAETITDPPITLDPLELLAEYQADPEGTLAKYEGERLFFPNVRVDAMSFLGEPPDTDLFVQMENIKFRVEYPAQLVRIREGYIVEATGELWGMQWGYLIIKDCWLKVIDPPGGTDDPPPEY